MKSFRKVSTDYWQNDGIIDLPWEEKCFYMYLLTNTKTNQIGIYKLPKKIIKFETDLKEEELDSLIEKMIAKKKIKYCDGEFFILNWWKYNWTKSPKIETRIIKEFETINDKFKDEILKIMIEYGYSIDTLSIQYGYGMDTYKKRIEENRQELEERKEEETIPYNEIINYLNEVASKSYKNTTTKTRTSIKARWNDMTNCKFEDKIKAFKYVIDVKSSEWKNTEHDKYLRPETLFGTKFESYRNQNPSKQKGVAGIKNTVDAGLDWANGK